MTTSANPSAKNSTWQALTAHRAELGDHHLNALFAADPARATRMQAEACGLFLDYSKNRVTADTLALLFQLAREAGLSERTTAMFDGARINTTERRAVLHTALRRPAGTSLTVDGQDLMTDILAVRERIRRFSEQVRVGSWLGYSGRPITDVVNIGIGGSDLG
ncbi:MAG: glucose-6-phosphate isomerase, partial [Betaproteobacteria bacterium HGW-Betaproteobacteria-21]